MKICIAGKNDIAVNGLDFLLKNMGITKQDILVINNLNDTGEDNWQKSLKKYAINNELTIIKLEEVYEIEDLIFISLEFDRILKPDKFKSNKLFNLHFSLLPKFKGMHVNAMHLLHGEKNAGVTFHCIDEGIDTGNIIAQKSFEIDINDTARDLYFKFLHQSFELFKEIINSIINSEYTSYSQSVIGSSYFSRSALDFKNIQIDFKKTSFEIHNQLRAFIFKEFQYPKIKGENIIKSILTDQKINKNYFEEQQEMFLISGIDGYLIKAIKEQS